MSTKTIECELIELEKQYWQAIKAGDFDGALRLTDDPCIVAGASGVSRIDNATFRDMMKDVPWTLQSFEFKGNSEVRMLGDDVGILAYTIHEVMTVDGKPTEFDAAHSSTWLKRNGKWVCAMHTESIAGDPFGR